MADRTFCDADESTPTQEIEQLERTLEDRTAVAIGSWPLRDAFDVELLLTTGYVGYRVPEVAVTWTHKPGSQVRLVRDSLRMARELMRIRTYAMRGEYAVPHVAIPIGR